MIAGIAGTVGMQTLTAGAPVAQFAAGYASHDIGLAIAAGVVTAIVLIRAMRLDRREARLKELSAQVAAGLPALPARG